jgi:hypothetical protein
MTRSPVQAGVLVGVPDIASRWSFSTLDQATRTRPEELHPAAT